MKPTDTTSNSPTAESVDDDIDRTDIALTLEIADVARVDPRLQGVLT